MPHEVVVNLGLAVVFCFVGGLVGIALVLCAAAVLPRVIDRFTPDIDEGKEIARGNVAVAEYFGRVVSAAIIASGIVAAAAILGGLIAALH
jgi:hypothetical protein